MLFCQFFQKKISFFKQKLDILRIKVEFPKGGDHLFWNFTAPKNWGWPGNREPLPLIPPPVTKIFFLKEEKKNENFCGTPFQNRKPLGGTNSRHIQNIWKKFFDQKMYWKSQKNFILFEKNYWGYPVIARKLRLFVFWFFKICFIILFVRKIFCTGNSRRIFFFQFQNRREEWRQQQKYFSFS